MSKFKTFHSILVGHFALAVFLSLLLMCCSVCADDVFGFESIQNTYSEEELNKILTVTSIELANKAEVALDGWRTWYCQEFQSQFYNNQSAWSAVMTKCIDPLASNPPYPQQLLDEFPNVKTETLNTMVLELHSKCSNLVENPCFEADWLKVKKCARDDFIFIPFHGAEFLSTHHEEILVGKVLIFSIVMDSGISKCTFKTLVIPRGP